MTSPRPLFALLLPLALCAATGAARAELVVLADGSTLKVEGYEVTADDRAELTFSHGGRLTLPVDRIERVVDDEVEEPELPVVAIGPPMPDPAEPQLALAFDEAQQVPGGPYGPQIFAAAKKHQVNPSVVAALIRAESSGNPRAVSRKGARGLMQLMPSTAKRFGVRADRLFEPEQNLEAGVRYLKFLIEQFPGDLARVLAAYNAGEQAVQRYGGVPPYRETRGYVRRIYTFLGLAVGNLDAVATAGAG
ncbi:MAG TPA: lytic transglycosylase domain-containing protein [Thermoanaerobaculia bacterium]|nr:lytic transglycosylase domain-containing protein [Thermoanaerobaculia bacterium]